jgi:hypothetical protein
VSLGEATFSEIAALGAQWQRGKEEKTMALHPIARRLEARQSMDRFVPRDDGEMSGSLWIASCLAMTGK